MLAPTREDAQTQADEDSALSVGATNECDATQYRNTDGACEHMTTCTGSQYENDPPAREWTYAVQTHG